MAVLRHQQMAIRLGYGRRGLQVRRQQNRAGHLARRVVLWEYLHRYHQAALLD